MRIIANKHVFGHVDNMDSRRFEGNIGLEGIDGIIKKRRSLHRDQGQDAWNLRVLGNVQLMGQGGSQFSNLVDLEAHRCSPDFDAGLEPFCLQSALMSPSEVRHGFFSKLGGISEGRYSSLNASAGVGDDPVAVRANREIALRTLGLEASTLVIPECVHGARVITLRQAPSPSQSIIWSADGVITNLTTIAILIATADCFPVVFFAPDAKAYGVVHAGWKGLIAGIVQLAVDSICHEFRADPGLVRVAIGPGIGPCCYRLKKPVQREYREWNTFLSDTHEGLTSVDLSGFLKHALFQSGVKPDNVDSLDVCTSCRRDLFFSYRRDGPKSGRFPTIVGRP